MRALRVHEFGGLDRLVLDDDVPVPEPGKGEVRVRVEAAGVNFADILMIAGKYQLRPPLPFSPGFEVAGRIDAVGPGVDGWSVGDPVTGTPWFGGYAEYVVLPSSGIFSRPDYITSVSGAASTTTFGTAYHALVDRASIKAGDLLLVTGATGGVGSAAVQVGKALGAKVIAAVGSDSKVAAAEDLGCDAAVCYGVAEVLLREQVASAAEGSGKIDVILDTVGGEFFGIFLRELAPGGRALVVGFTDGNIPSIPANILLLKEAAAVGVFWGAFREREPRAAQAQLDRVWEWIRNGSVQLPPAATNPIEAGPDVLAGLAARRVIGKAVLVTE